METQGGKEGGRVTSVLLQASEVLGLLNGTLKVDPDGPQIPQDASLYLQADGDALFPLVSSERHPDGRSKKGRGVGLGIYASNAEWLPEGSQMSVTNVRFVPVS